MKTKYEKEETKKSLDDLENEKIDGALILGGGTNTSGLNSTNDEEDIILEGNGKGTRNAASETSGKPELL